MSKPIKKNFSLTKKSHAFATKVKSMPGNPSQLSKLAQLGFAIGLNYPEHTAIEIPTENIADTSAIDDDNVMHMLYTEIYPNNDDGTVKTWVNIERASSYGLNVLEEKYFDDHENLIKWKDLYNDLAN